MSEPEAREYFDPRRLRSKEEQVLPVPEAPRISLGQSGAATAAEPTPVRVAGDIRFHPLELEVRTPMPEAWLALVAGLLTALSVFLTWAHVPSGSGRLSLSAMDLGSYGRVVLAAGAVTLVLGLLGALFRVGRLSAFAWVSGLAGALTALDLVLKLANHDLTAEVQGRAAHPHLAVPGLALLVLGTVLTLLAALWASRPHVGR